MGVIYKATNLINGKSYIGQTNNFNRRKREHKRYGSHPDKNRTNKTSYFYSAILKYGFENFKWEILEECPNELLNEKERYYIKQYNTYSQGYNLTLGGDDSDALKRWRKENPDKAKDIALKNMEQCQKWCEDHRKEHLKQLALARQKGVDATKRKVRCIEQNLIFESLAEAERWSLSPNNPLNKKASHQHISKVCKGQRQTCGGYHWKYV